MLLVCSISIPDILYENDGSVTREQYTTADTLKSKPLLASTESPGIKTLKSYSFLFSKVLSANSSTPTLELSLLYI